MRRGKLQVLDEHCPEARRVIRVARLIDEYDIDLLLPLRDVQLLAISGDLLTFSGYEGLQALDRERLYRQGWIARVVTEEHVRLMGSNAVPRPRPNDGQNSSPSPS